MRGPHEGRNAHLVTPPRVLLAVGAATVPFMPRLTPVLASVTVCLMVGVVLVAEDVEGLRPASTSTDVVEVAALVPSGEDSWRLERADVPEAGVDDWIREKERAGGVAARPGRVRALEADPMRSRQWGYDRLASERTSPKGEFGAGVTVAVIDTGVDAAHPELTGRVLEGKDFVSPSGDGRSDANGHGTHVSGVIAAASGNGEGIAGIAPKVKILPVRVLDKTGWGDDAQVAEGIVWAVDNGADILNLSLGTHDPNPLMRTAVNYAQERGVLVVAAAGNDGSSGPKSYPAAWESVLAVAATTPMDTVASFSTAGDYVDVAAPGSLIMSTVPGGYAPMSGTSMATPHVTAAAALLMASGYRAEQAHTRLLETAIDLAPRGIDDRTGRGLIDPARALGLDPIDPPGTGPALPELPSPTMPNPGQPGTPQLPELPELPALPEPTLPNPTLPNPTLPNPTLPNPTLPRPGDPSPAPGEQEQSVRILVAARAQVVGQRWRVVAQVPERALTARIACADGWFRIERVTSATATFRPLVDRTHRGCQVISGQAQSQTFTLTALPRKR